MQRFLNTPARTKKPRNTGLTMVIDKGLSPVEAKGLMQVASAHIDIIKLGWATAYVTGCLQEKIKIYQSHDISVYLGGTFFEICYAQNRLKEYVAALNSLNLNHVEVSDGTVVIPRREKSRWITELSKNFTVLSEVGSKDESVAISPQEWVDNINADLDAGSWRVITESRESGTVGIYFSNESVRLNLIDEIYAQCDISALMFEVPKKEQQVYFIKLFGPEVNLANVPPNEVVGLETLRLGLRADTMHLSCKGV